MPDIDLATILADGEYLRRVGDTLDGGPGGSAESAVDAVATALVAGSNIDVTYNDVAGTITVAVEDDVVTSTTVDLLVTLTQAAYDAIGTKDPNTLYFITLMPDIKFAAADVAAMKHGTTNVTKVMLGTTEVWPGGAGALLLNDPCNDFTTTPWTTAGSAAINAGGHTGNGFSIPANTSNSVSYDIASAAQTDIVTVGFWVKFSSLPGSATAFLAWRSDAGATSHVTLRIYSAGTLAFYRTSPLTALGSPVAHGMVTGTWYFLEASVKLSDTVGQVTVRKNGVLLYGTPANVDTKSGGTKTVFDQVRFAGATGMAFILDDIYIRNDATFGL